MDKKRLLELAGINEVHAVGDTVSKIADAFAAAIDAQGLEQGDADDWADANNELMAALHEELKHRGYYGA